jgi:preprotein translocase subunit SecG
MYLTLTIIIVIAAIILTFVVLIQNSKGGGLAAGFASANQVFGVRKTTDRIEKFTWILIGTIVVLSIFSSGFHKRDIGGGTASELSKDAIENVNNAQKAQQQTQPIDMNGGTDEE